MKCPYPECGKEVDTTYFKDGAGQCNNCNRIIEYDDTITIDNLKKIITENFGKEAWNDFDIIISVPSIMLLKDISNPLGLILEGAPSSNKTTLLSLLYGHYKVYHCDDFTPKAFISHAANIKEKDKRKNDLLPKIKDKLFIVPELAPMFNKRKEDLIENLGILTRVFDGEGLITSSGLGTRKYEGEYLFTFIGATTPISKVVWNTLGKLGNRWLSLTIKKKEKSEEYLLTDVIGKKAFREKINACKPPARKFLTDLIDENGGLYTIDWDRENDNKEIKKKLVKLTKLVVKLRAPLQIWKERDDSNDKNQFAFTSPIIEEPERLLTLFYNLARGHAIAHRRTKLNESDWKIVLRVGLSTMPYERAHLFKVLLEHGGQIHSEEIQKKMSVSQSTASRIMETLKVLQIVEEATSPKNLEKIIALKKEFEWILKEEVIVEKEKPIKEPIQESDGV
jgi:hypothetical protein